MDAVLDILHAVNIVSGAVLIGALVTESLLLIPLFRSLPPERGQEALRTLSPIAWRRFPIFGGSMTASAFAIVFIALAEGDLGETGNLITLAATLVTGVAFLSNIFLYLRADRAARSLEANRLAREFAGALERIHRLNLVRLSLFGCAFVLFVVGALAD